MTSEQYEAAIRPILSELVISSQTDAGHIHKGNMQRAIATLVQMHDQELAEVSAPYHIGIDQQGQVFVQQPSILPLKAAVQTTVQTVQRVAYARGEQVRNELEAAHHLFMVALLSTLGGQVTISKKAFEQASMDAGITAENDATGNAKVYRLKQSGILLGK
jgi:hypothetical protein